MLVWAVLIPALPLASFAILAMASWLPRRAVAVIGTGAVAASMAVAVILTAGFASAPPPGHVVRISLWNWLNVVGLQTGIGLYVDALALVMATVITTVAFLIHLYSIAFMAGEDGYRRFFACMNLFVGAMLLLVLADNLLLLYVGWEGVGLCSYLLIGFWYRDPAAGRAAIKAFVVTRIGDAALAVGLLLLVATFGTLDIQQLAIVAPQRWAVGSAPAVAVAALLLAGAVGKSAQLPLQTWLPDAMAGPTPVSALIHAATMVTAGVYLIARTHALFALAPAIQLLVAVVGALTLLLAGVAASMQHDIKRVLAYSTMSQVGYMFLGLGVGAWSASIFHFATHAFFKALLFLSAGVVIQAMGGEHDMFRMGGLRKRIPLTFWTFLIAALSLAAIPPVTAGFSSKDWILYRVWCVRPFGPWLWLAGWAGVVLTSLYAFRMVFLVFFGPESVGSRPRPSWPIVVPLVTMAVVCTLGGFIEWPRSLGDYPLFSRLVGTALPSSRAEHAGYRTEAALELASEAASLVGLAAAWWFYVRRRDRMADLAGGPVRSAVHQLWAAGWGFDWLYDRLLVRPLVGLAYANRADAIDLPFRAVGWLAERAHGGLSLMQSGLVRRYAFWVMVGAVVLLAAILWL